MDQERSLFFLQRPCSALYWQNLTAGAKVKCLRGPPSVSQYRPRRMDLELRNNKLVTGERCNLFDNKTTSPAFFCLLFARLIFLYPLTFSQSVSLYLKCISSKQHVLAFFKIYSVNFWFLIGMFAPFTFIVIINMIGFRSTSLLFVFCLFPLFLLPSFFLTTHFVIPLTFFRIKFYFISWIFKHIFFSFFQWLLQYYSILP